MNNESTPETTTPTPEETTTVEAEAQAEAPAETQKTLPPLTAERFTDITLGLGKAAVDVLDKAAQRLDDSVRQIREDAPGFLADMEERGRPIREKIGESLKGFNITDAFNKATRPGDSPGADPEAMDDIEALENRVRELEQQVSTEPATAPEPEKAADPSPFSMLELDDEPAPVAEATPAEKPKPKTAKPAAPRTRKKPEGETAG
jgi:hypothetical protein